MATEHSTHDHPPHTGESVNRARREQQEKRDVAAAEQRVVPTGHPHEFRESAEHPGIGTHSDGRPTVDPRISNNHVSPV